MAEPQLSIRSAKAKRLAQQLAHSTGLSMNRIVEQALEHYDNELRAVQPIDAVWDLAAEGRKGIKAGTTSAHENFVTTTACRDDRARYSVTLAIALNDPVV